MNGSPAHARRRKDPIPTDPDERGIPPRLENTTILRRFLRLCFPSKPALLIALFTCVIVPASLVGIHIHENPKLSPIDEGAHLDYVTRIEHGSMPRLGQRLQPSTLRVTACAGFVLKVKLPACDARKLTPQEFPGGGYQYEAQQPPTYLRRHCSVPTLLLRRTRRERSGRHSPGRHLVARGRPAPSLGGRTVAGTHALCDRRRRSPDRHRATGRLRVSDRDKRRRIDSGRGTGPLLRCAGLAKARSVDGTNAPRRGGRRHILQIDGCPARGGGRTGVGPSLRGGVARRRWHRRRFSADSCAPGCRPVELF
jgi:hypothetical protein